MRDITLEDTFRHAFTTRAFATGIPGTLGGTPVLSVLEENNATPITAGVSVSTNRASVTGLNEATIVATAANGYEDGKSYAIYISTGVVDSVSVVGEVVGEFTIQKSAAAIELRNGTDGLTALKSVFDNILTRVPTVAVKAILDAWLALGETGTAQSATGSSIVLAASSNAANGYYQGWLLHITGGTGIGQTRIIHSWTGAADSADVQPDWAINPDNTSTYVVFTIGSYQSDVNTWALNIVTVSGGNPDVNVESIDDIDAPATWKASMNAQVDTAWTTEMADSVANDGTIATREQALYLAIQMLTEFAISGTTWTTKKVDGSTTLATFTLSDATNPTSITRS